MQGTVIVTLTRDFWMLTLLRQFCHRIHLCKLLQYLEVHMTLKGSCLLSVSFEWPPSIKLMGLTLLDISLIYTKKLDVSNTSPSSSQKQSPLHSFSLIPGWTASLIVPPQMASSAQSFLFYNSEPTYLMSKKNSEPISPNRILQLQRCTRAVACPTTTTHLPSFHQGQQNRDAFLHQQSKKMLHHMVG